MPIRHAFALLCLALATGCAVQAQTQTTAPASQPAVGGDGAIPMRVHFTNTGDMP